MNTGVDLAPGVRDGEEADMQPWRRPSALKIQVRLETLTVWEKGDCQGETGRIPRSMLQDVLWHEGD